MKSALFVSIPLVGHITPLLRQAEELARRGWRVGIASTQEIQAFIEANSCESVYFVDLGTAPQFKEEWQQVEQAASKDRLFEISSLRIVNALGSLWSVFFEELLKVVRQERPDVLIVDFMTRAGIDVAEIEKIPVMINNPDLLTTISIEYLPPAYNVPLPYSGHSIHRLPWYTQWSYPILRWLAARFVDATVGYKLNQIRAKQGLEAISLNRVWGDHPVIVNSAFGLEYPRPLPDNIKMVGPMLPSMTEPLSIELEDWLNNGTPVVYVNLGTLAMASSDQLDRMYRAFANAPFRVWWILRASMQELLPKTLAPNIRVEAWSPSLLTVLKHPAVGVFVSHCGINSVHESLASGTPIVGIPMFADQFDMAMRIQDAGVGLFVDKHSFSSDELRSTIETVLSNPSFLAPIPAIQASFREAGGISYAVDLIEQEAMQPTRQTTMSC